MDNNLKSLIGEVLNVDEDSERLEKVMNILEEHGIKIEDDLKYLNRDDFGGELTDEEFKLISNPILRMSIAEALDYILKHPQPNVIERFRENGCSTAYDLKYFDWCALKELKCLSEMHIKKIMRFIEEHFPEEYNEHKSRKSEKDHLERELDLLDFQASLEKESQHFRDTIDETLENQHQVLEDTPQTFNETPRSEEASHLPNGVLQFILPAIVHMLFNIIKGESGENITFRDIELD